MVLALCYTEASFEPILFIACLNTSYFQIVEEVLPLCSFGGTDVYAGNFHET